MTDRAITSAAIETIEATPSALRQTIDEALRSGLFDVEIRLDQTIEWALLHKRVTIEQVGLLREAGHMLAGIRNDLDNSDEVAKQGPGF